MCQDENLAVVCQGQSFRAPHPHPIIFLAVTLGVWGLGVWLCAHYDLSELQIRQPSVLLINKYETKTEWSLEMCWRKKKKKSKFRVKNNIIKTIPPATSSGNYGPATQAHLALSLARQVPRTLWASVFSSVKWHPAPAVIAKIRWDGVGSWIWFCLAYSRPCVSASVSCSLGKPQGLEIGRLGGVLPGHLVKRGHLRKLRFLAQSMWTALSCQGLIKSWSSEHR